MGSHFYIGFPFQTEGLDQFRKTFLEKTQRCYFANAENLITNLWKVPALPCIGRISHLEGVNFCTMKMTSTVAMNNYGFV